ncbi:MAG: Inner membrane protein YhjD [Sodalis sp.]|nr:MAG: Inner membrane protein YhjD [Sodalis sp.]
MRNLLEAIRAQPSNAWERNPQGAGEILPEYLRDLVSLIGLVVALIVTPSLTFVFARAQ